MPDFDFDAFNHDQIPENGEVHHENHENHESIESPIDPVVNVSEPEPVKAEVVTATAQPASSGTDHLEEVDKW